MPEGTEAVAVSFPGVLDGMVEPLVVDGHALVHFEGRLATLHRGVAIVAEGLVVRFKGVAECRI